MNNYVFEDLIVNPETPGLEDLICPFFIEVPNGMIINYACIVPKKEESVERSVEVKKQA